MIYQKKYFIRKDNLNNINVFQNRKSKLIEENYFVIDSNNLEHAESHMYGFCVSKIGILTDNYYKKILNNDYSLFYFKDMEAIIIYFEKYSWIL